MSIEININSQTRTSIDDIRSEVRSRHNAYEYMGESSGKPKLAAWLSNSGVDRIRAQQIIAGANADFDPEELRAKLAGTAIQGAMDAMGSTDLLAGLAIAGEYATATGGSTGLWDATVAQATADVRARSGGAKLTGGESRPKVNALRPAAANSWDATVAGATAAYKQGRKFEPAEPAPASKHTASWDATVAKFGGKA